LKSEHGQNKERYRQFDVEQLTRRPLTWIGTSKRREGDKRREWKKENWGGKEKKLRRRE